MHDYNAELSIGTSMHALERIVENIHVHASETNNYYEIILVIIFLIRTAFMTKVIR